METYHSGELEAQRRTGARELAARVGRIIGPIIPAEAAAFLSRRRLVVVSTTTSDARVHASILGGPSGFAEALDPSTMTLRPEAGDRETILGDLRDTGFIGLLAIDFSTRRRIRVNGTGFVNGGEIVISTREVYSNCPQYIHPHEQPAWGRATSFRTAQLDERQMSLITSENTFFIASSHPDRGADASHRGGEPGFVSVTPSTVAWLDYPGNNMFNTLGNLLVNDRCSLLFVDFASGGALRIDGRAAIEWDDPRHIEVTIEGVVEQRPG